MAFKRGLFLFGGICSLILGLVGIILPIMPTVPFILLAAFCFARSSDRLHGWLMEHPWFSEALKNWQTQGAIRSDLKTKAYWASGLSFSVSIIMVPLIWVKVLLFVIAVALMLYLRSIPEITQD